VSVIVCGAGPKPTRRSYRECEDCKRRTRHVTTFDGVYYGTTTYCCACFGKEQDGEWMPAWPDHPYRAENEQYIKRLWAEAGTPAQYRAQVRAIEELYR
jgi:hypothetical protein